MTDLLRILEAAWLCIGIGGAALALLGLVIAGCWMVLKYADWRGVWMDEHPEPEKSKRGGERQ